jgi:hypothetical protein
VEEGINKDTLFGDMPIRHVRDHRIFLGQIKLEMLNTVQSTKNRLVSDHGALRVPSGARGVAEHVVSLGGRLIQLNIWMLFSYIDNILEVISFEADLFSLFAAFLVNLIEADDVIDFVYSALLLLLEKSS